MARSVDERRGMIIVEGPDGGGKTRLISRLSSDLGLPVAQRVVSAEAEAMTDLKTWVDLNLIEGNVAVLFDRHRLISEPIYGPVLRYYPEDGFDNVDWLTDSMRRLHELDPFVIW